MRLLQMQICKSRAIGHPFSYYPTQLANGDYKLTFDQPFTYDNSELSGFFSCCGQPGFCRWIPQNSTDPSQCEENLIMGENLT